MADRQQFAMVPIHQVHIGDNVRRDLGDLDGLIVSVREHGILEPLVCCPNEDHTAIEVLMGHRRLAAALAAGLTDVPCVLRVERPSELGRLLMQLTENLQRSDMSPIDEAMSYRELLDRGFTQTAIAREVGRTESHVSKRLQLLGLPDTIKVALDVGWITPTLVPEIPKSLWQDKAALKRLAPVIQHGNDAVRRWVKDESRDVPGRAGWTAGAPSSPGRVASLPQDRVWGETEANRTLNVRASTYDAVRAAARRAGKSVVDWASDVLVKAAEKQQ